jgi:hypothetical protein
MWPFLDPDPEPALFLDPAASARPFFLSNYFYYQKQVRSGVLPIIPPSPQKHRLSNFFAFKRHADLLVLALSVLPAALIKRLPANKYVAFACKMGIFLGTYALCDQGLLLAERHLVEDLYQQERPRIEAHKRSGDLHELCFSAVRASDNPQ